MSREGLVAERSPGAAAAFPCPAGDRAGAAHCAGRVRLAPGDLDAWRGAGLPGPLCWVPLRRG